MKIFSHAFMLLNATENYEKGCYYKVLNLKDYIIYMLTGRFVTDYSDGMGTNMVDLSNLRWSDEIIETMGIDGDKLPELRESTYVVGYVTKGASEETGLSRNTRVVCGGGDGVWPVFEESYNSLVNVYEKLAALEF